MSPETQSAVLLIEAVVEKLNQSLVRSRPRSLAITKLEEAAMWLGKDLQEMDVESPYPRSHDPASPVIDPSAPEATGVTCSH